MEAKDLKNLMEAYASVYVQPEEIIDEDMNPAEIERIAAAAAADATGKKRRKPAKLSGPMREEIDLFDIILEYLVAEGYADTNENALVIMANMSEEWRQSIVDESVLDVARKVGSAVSNVAGDIKNRLTGKKELLGGGQGYVRVGGPSKPGDVRVSGIGPVGTYGRKQTPQSGVRTVTSSMSMRAK